MPGSPCPAGGGGCTVRSPPERLAFTPRPLPRVGRAGLRELGAHWMLRRARVLRAPDPSSPLWDLWGPLGVRVARRHQGSRGHRAQTDKIVKRCQFAAAVL